MLTHWYHGTIIKFSRAKQPNKAMKTKPNAIQVAARKTIRSSIENSRTPKTPKIEATQNVFNFDLSGLTINLFF